MVPPRLLPATLQLVSAAVRWAASQCGTAWSPSSGLLELGVVTARNPVQWARTFGPMALGQPERSPFAKVTRGKKVKIRFDQKVRFELDGGARPARRKLRIKAWPRSVTVCVPREQARVS